MPSIVLSSLLLGNAMGPMALLLVGATLANARIGTLIGLHGLPLTILVVTASLPIGANVFMFSQRYQVAEELVTASVGVSSVLAVFTVSLTMALAGRL